MPTPSCLYCGSSLRRGRKGRLATTEQLEQAAVFHHPHSLMGKHICETHRLHPPTGPASSSKPKRNHSVSLSLDSSSPSSVSKRQRVAKILSSLSQPPQQPSAISTVESATLTSTSSSQSVTTSMSISQDDDSDVLSNTTNTTSRRSSETLPKVHLSSERISSKTKMSHYG